MLLFQLSVHASQSVTLTWNPNVAQNVAGYKIYSGTISRNYSATNMFGLVTAGTISGMVQGRTYYFAAATYDGAGHQSALSSEVAFTVPATAATLGTLVPAGKSLSFLVSGVTSARYVVQASTNLLKWVSLQTNTAPFTFWDTNAAAFKQRFYRAYYLSP